jgi:hypothetical protein
MAAAALFDTTNFNEKSTLQGAIPIRELKEGHLYRIEGARIVNTKFGTRILLALTATEKENMFEVFLPGRFITVITPDTIEDFNKRAALHQLGVRFTAIASRYAEVSISEM